MWNEPYLETCCRAALHRLVLAGSAGRPMTESDSPCLERLAGMGLASLRPDGRAYVLPAGRDRHATEIAGRR
jgi:hypothetical protein